MKKINTYNPLARSHENIQLHVVHASKARSVKQLFALMPKTHTNTKRRNTHWCTHVASRRFVEQSDLEWNQTGTLKIVSVQTAGFMLFCLGFQKISYDAAIYRQLIAVRDEIKKGVDYVFFVLLSIFLRRDYWTTAQVSNRVFVSEWMGHFLLLWFLLFPFIWGLATS